MSGIHLRGHARVPADAEGVTGTLAGAKHCGVMAAKSLVLPRFVNMWSQNRAPSGHQPTVLGSSSPVHCPPINSWQQAEERAPNCEKSGIHSGIYTILEKCGELHDEGMRFLDFGASRLRSK